MDFYQYLELLDEQPIGVHYVTRKTVFVKTTRGWSMTGLYLGIVSAGAVARDMLIMDTDDDPQRQWCLI